MRLVEWRRQEGLSQVELADRLGCDQSYVSLIERGEPERMPRRDMMVKIYRVTRGAVAPNDFYDLPDLSEVQLALPIEASAELQLDEAA
jgi:transcriptional regulator with XRE-family HTH domain